MNKKLVAVAIAGLLAAPLAQAQTANVTLYGRINIDMEFVNGRLANNTNPNVYRVASNSSRFGLRGTESLGGGLNAIFQIENGSIRPTTGDGGNLAGRDSFVGLSGGWGTFKMGRYLAPYDDMHGIFGNDNTASTSILSTAALWAQGFAGQPTNGGFDDRLQQSIRYETPSYSGFVFKGAVLDHGRHEQPDQRELPVEQHQRPELRRSCTATARSSSVPRTNITTTSAGTVDSMPLSDWAFSVAAKWQFSGFNVAGVYEKMEYEVSNGTTRSTGQEQAEAQFVLGAGHHDQRRRERAGVPVLGQGFGRHRQRGRHAATDRHPLNASTRRKSRASPASPRATTRAPPSGK